jgi:hypothetical protein
MPGRSQASTVIALRVHAEGRNVTQAKPPVALAEKLNAGWHLNVPSRRLFPSYCSFCQMLKQHSCQTTKSAANRAHVIHLVRDCGGMPPPPTDAIGEDPSGAPEN